MAGATIAPALPLIEIHFSDIPNAALLTRLVLTIPALFIALSSFAAGHLVDRYGRLPVIYSGLILYALSGMAPLIIDNIYLILISRALLGIGVAGLMTSLTTLIADYFEGEERNRFMGLQASFMALGGFVFLLAGGSIAEFGWRWPFLLYGLALLIFPLTKLGLYEPFNQYKNIKNDNGDLYLSGSAKFIIGGTLFLGFLLFVVFYMMPVQLPFHLRIIGITSSSQTGIALASLTLSAGISGLLYRRIRARLSFNQIYLVSFSFAAAGYFLVAQFEDLELIIMSQIIGGLGFGLFMPNSNLCLMNLTPTRMRGRIMGAMTAAVFLGQFSSPILSNPVRVAYSYKESFVFAGYLLAFVAIIFLIILSYQSFVRPKKRNLKFLQRCKNCLDICSPGIIQIKMAVGNHSVGVDDICCGNRQHGLFLLVVILEFNILLAGEFFFIRICYNVGHIVGFHYLIIRIKKQRDHTSCKFFMGYTKLFFTLRRNSY